MRFNNIEKRILLDVTITSRKIASVDPRTVARDVISEMRHEARVGISQVDYNELRSIEIIESMDEVEKNLPTIEEVLEAVDNKDEKMVKLFDEAITNWCRTIRTLVVDRQATFEYLDLK